MLGITTTILRKLPKNNFHAKIYNGFKLHQSKVFNTFEINNNRILLSQSEVKLFSTTEQRTAIPPIPPWFLAYATLLIKPVARFLPPLIGVFFRKYRKDLPSFSLHPLFSNDKKIKDQLRFNGFLWRYSPPYDFQKHQFEGRSKSHDDSNYQAMPKKNNKNACMEENSMFTFAMCV